MNNYRKIVVKESSLLETAKILKRIVGSVSKRGGQYVKDPSVHLLLEEEQLNSIFYFLTEALTEEELTGIIKK